MKTRSAAEMTDREFSLSIKKDLLNNSLIEDLSNQSLLALFLFLNLCPYDAFHDLDEVFLSVKDEIIRRRIDISGFKIKDVSFRSRLNSEIDQKFLLLKRKLFEIEKDGKSRPLFQFLIKKRLKKLKDELRDYRKLLREEKQRQKKSSKAETKLFEKNTSLLEEKVKNLEKFISRIEMLHLNDENEEKKKPNQKRKSSRN